MAKLIFLLNNTTYIILILYIIYMENILLTLRNVTKEELRILADKESRSINNYINVVLEAKVKEDLKDE